MSIREQILADDVRKEFRAGDLDLLAAVLRAEGTAEDAGGGLVPGGQKALDMQAGINTLPAGGEEYQVLQRDGDGKAVWDWVRYVVPESEEE